MSDFVTERQQRRWLSNLEHTHYVVIVGGLITALRFELGGKSCISEDDDEEYLFNLSVLTAEPQICVTSEAAAQTRFPSKIVGYRLISAVFGAYILL